MVVGKLFAGDYRGASELMLTPPNVSPADFWKSRFDSFQRAGRNQTAGLVSCSVNGSTEDPDLARRIEATGYRVLEAKRVALDCIPFPGFAATPGTSRVVNINSTWKVYTALSLLKGAAPLGLPQGHLGLAVFNVTNRSFDLGAKFDEEAKFNLTDLGVFVDGKGVEGGGQFKGGNISSGGTVRVDTSPAEIRPGTQLRLLHRPSNKTAEFVVNPRPP